MIGKPLLDASGAVDLFKISEAVWAREAKHGFRALSNPERVFFCVWSLEAEVNNGGFSRFFYNSAGDYAAETPGALKTIGAAGMADLVERAMAVFGAARQRTARSVWRQLRLFQSLRRRGGRNWMPPSLNSPHQRPSFAPLSKRIDRSFTHRE